MEGINLKIFESFKIRFLKANKTRGKSVSKLKEFHWIQVFPRGTLVQIAHSRKTDVLPSRILKKSGDMTDAISLPVFERGKLIMIFPLTNLKKLTEKSFPAYA